MCWRRSSVPSEAIIVSRCNDAKHLDEVSFLSVILPPAEWRKNRSVQGFEGVSVASARSWTASILQGLKGFPQRVRAQKNTAINLQPNSLTMCVLFLKEVSKAYLDQQPRPCFHLIFSECGVWADIVDCYILDVMQICH